jgi:RHS repeat-associated protein
LGKSSVRQMADASGEVVHAAFYSPYGEVLSTAGAAQTSYGYTGEQQDASGMVYLRARYYEPYLNQFIQPDTIVPDPRVPADWNKYTYTRDNPVNYTDPTGYIAEPSATNHEAEYADLLVEQLFTVYGVRIVKDWGYIPPMPDLGCYWEEGSWRSYQELEITRDAIASMAATLHGIAKFKSAMGGYTVNIHRVPTEFYRGHGGWSMNNVILPNNPFDSTKRLWTIGTIVHELAHVWDTRHWFQPGIGMMYATRSYGQKCNKANGIVTCFDFYDKSAAIEEAPTDYAKGNEREDWADSFTVFMYSSSDVGMLRPLGPIRKKYIQDEINNLP